MDKDIAGEGKGGVGHGLGVRSPFENSKLEHGLHVISYYKDLFVMAGG